MKMPVYKKLKNTENTLLEKMKLWAKSILKIHEKPK